MELPSFWRRAAFTVAETAALIHVSEDTLRTWLARNVANDFSGVKEGGRIRMSAQDAFYFLLVRDFTGFGVPVKTAMLTATFQAQEVSRDLPLDPFLLVRANGASWTFELTDAPEFGAATLVIPLRQSMLDLIDRAAAVYAREEPA